jgi:hypothetical protein
MLVFGTFKETATPETFAQIGKGDITLWFVGKVKYDDVFVEAHTFTCKSVFNPVLGTFFLGDEDYPKAET